ncbi:MAG: hypothetical protein J6D18_00665, partial [Erysipelotrichaceae bacterium]|nr:hypothetical protein [Erysipelotrichaceae bacterium]
LVPKQKENINAYFKEHAGKTLTQIFTDLKNKEKNQAGKEEDNVKEIVEYLSGWPDYDRSVKLKIVDYKETYLNMSVEHQQQVNNAAKKYSSYDFMSLVNYYEPESESSNSTTTTPAEQSGTVSSASQYQAQINELQQTLVEYENYGVQLQQQLAATTDSQMAATIQAEIAANNQMIQQYQIQIYQLQNEMEASGQ